MSVEYPNNVLKIENLKGKTIPELSKYVLVYRGSAFNGVLYMLPSRKQYLSTQDFLKYAEERQNTTFLLLDYNNVPSGNIYQYIENYKNKSNITFLTDNGAGKLVKIGSCVCDKLGYNSITTTAKNLIAGPGCEVKASVAGRDNDPYIEFTFTGSDLINDASKRIRCWSYSYGGSEYVSRVTHDFIALGDAHQLFGQKVTTYHILKYCLDIVDDARIYQEFHYSSILLKVGLPGTPELGLSVKERYALKREDCTHQHWYGNRNDQIKTDEICEVELDEATVARVTEDIKKMLATKTLDKDPNRCYSSDSDAVVHTDILVIGNPIPGHRRPTYHIFRGASNCGYCDVVEICRGELQMIDMTPVNCYALIRDSMQYEHVTNRVYMEIKQSFFDSGDICIDPITLAQWSTKKAIVPTLLKSVALYTKSYPTSNEVMTFNRAKFGSLFMEHLIKAGYKDLAYVLCKDINSKADQMGEDCDSLSSILPGCNPEGTTLLETLNMSKPWLAKLWETFELLCQYGYQRDNQYRYGRRGRRRYHANETVLRAFISAYEMVKAASNGDGNISKEGESYLADLITLSDYSLSSVYTDDDEISIAEDRPMAKSVAKMLRKIAANFGKDSDAMRSYKEIVQTYVKIKAYGWVPEDMLIFIEFSLGGDQALENIKSREHAADTAYKAYQSKIDEVNRRRNEVRYQTRLPYLSKLETAKAILGYQVIAPVAIYDETLDYSLEKEGHDQSHCVFRSYALDQINGKYTIMLLRKALNPEKSVVTIGINSEGRINQTYGYYNRTITEEEAKVIIAWAKTLPGKVTFATDSGSPVAPGGWPASVPVPELPKINREWLEKAKGHTVNE